MPVTMVDLIELSKQLADKEDDEHVGDSPEWENRVNFGYRELWSLIRVLTRGEFFVTTSDFTIAPGATNTTVAAMGRLRQLFYRTGSAPDDIVPVRRYRLGEAPAMGRSYRVLGGTTIEISPASEAPGDYRLIYEQRFTEMSGVGSLDARLEEWKEFVATVAAIGAMGKEESDRSPLVERKAELAAEIRMVMADQDVTPDVIEDVYGGNVGGWPRLPLP